MRGSVGVDREGGRDPTPPKVNAVGVAEEYALPAGTHPGEVGFNCHMGLYDDHAKVPDDEVYSQVAASYYGRGVDPPP
jgi:hypothetical protein